MHDLQRKLKKVAAYCVTVAMADLTSIFLVVSFWSNLVFNIFYFFPFEKKVFAVWILLIFVTVMQTKKGLSFTSPFYRSATGPMLDPENVPPSSHARHSEQSRGRSPIKSNVLALRICPLFVKNDGANVIWPRIVSLLFTTILLPCSSLSGP